MLILLNIVLLSIAGLIAYWWANQGLFSALLHLFSVILAGALAFAFWEPLAFVLMKAGLVDYAWGISLLGLFTIALFVIRLICDRAAPGNIHVPHWASLTFGSVAGFAAAVLTIGMFVTGAGFIHSHREIMGFRGWQRDSGNAQVRQLNRLWIPYHEITDNFYGMLSVGSFSSSRPLRSYYPKLHRQATLLRDSYNEGRGSVAMRPGAVRVGEQLVVEDGGRRLIVIKVDFTKDAQDFGRILTLTSSQIRLIGYPTMRGAEAPVLHPTSWAQNHGRWSHYFFDSTLHSISSEPGKENLQSYIAFEAPPDFQARFIQIRGTRFAVPAPSQQQDVLVARLFAEQDHIAAEAPELRAIDRFIQVSKEIRPIVAGTNNLPGSIQHIDRNLSSGRAIFRGGQTLPPRNLRIMGIYEPPGTRSIKVDVSRGAVPLFDALGFVPSDSPIALMDTEGNRYTPVGYMFQPGDGTTEIELQPVRRIRNIDDIPTPSRAGNQTLELIFYVTENATISGLVYGDMDLGFASVRVPARTTF